MKFETYETSGGNSRWRLVATNGQEVANSGENFASHANAKRAAESFKKGAGKASFEVYESGDKWRWRAKAANGQIVGTSQMYTTKASAQAGAQAVQALVPSLTLL